MVLERFLEAGRDRKQPLAIFVFSLVLSLVSLFISYTIFKEGTGFFVVTLVSIGLIPFINSMLRYEEKETEETGQKQNFLERHGDIISAYSAMFLGMVIAMSFVFTLLPDNITEKVFNEQIREVKIIRGGFTFGNQFLDIFVNNIGVLMLSFLFSLILGAGSILIITWNASVLSAAIGLIAKSFGGIKGMPIGILTFVPHGTFELIAYFIGAIAGGLISVAILRKNSKNFAFILKDSILLLIISILFLIIGGIIETSIILGNSV